jgi:hypothetical protein
MDDNQSNINYLARLFGLIIALFLFGMAIWLVVRVVQRDDLSDVAVNGTETSAVVNTNSDLDILKGESDTRDFVITAVEDRGPTVTVEVLSSETANGALPNTGSETTIASLLAVSLFGGMVWQLVRSRRPSHRAI